MTATVSVKFLFWPFVIYIRSIVKALNCFLMPQRQVTLKDVCVYTKLE